MIYFKQKNIAVPSLQSSAVVTTESLSFFDDPNWDNVKIIMATEGTKFGVYFLAEAEFDYDNKVNISVVKPTKNPGDDMFSTEVASIYGLSVAESKLTRIDTVEIRAKLKALSKSCNARTLPGVLKLETELNTDMTYIFTMKFVNGTGIDTIDTKEPKARNIPNDKNLENYKEKKFLKKLGYTLPFDALICNGDRFNYLNFYGDSNFGNMVIDRDGTFIAIDNGINALKEVQDYEEVLPIFYQEKLRKLTNAVMTGDQDFVDQIASDISSAISLESPKLILNATQKSYIRDGIILGIHKLQSIQASDIMGLYEKIPEGSGKTTAARDIVLTGLAIVHEYQETDSAS